MSEMKCLGLLQYNLGEWEECGRKTKKKIGYKLIIVKVG